MWTLRLGLGICVSVTHILRSTIVANAFFSSLETHKSQNFPMVTPQGVAKLSISPKVTIFLPPVPYLFISDQCLKSDRWATLFSRNKTHKIWIILRGETYVSINLLVSTNLLLHRFNNIKPLPAKILANSIILFSKSVFWEIFIPSN